MLALLKLANRIDRTPVSISLPAPVFCIAERVVHRFRCRADPRPDQEYDRAREQHRDAEMLRADLVQDERREYENRQYEIQQDDFESGHGCTLAAGELETSVAPQAWACAGA